MVVTAVMMVAAALLRCEIVLQCLLLLRIEDRVDLRLNVGGRCSLGLCRLQNRANLRGLIVGKIEIRKRPKIRRARRIRGIGRADSLNETHRVRPSM